MTATTTVTTDYLHRIFDTSTVRPAYVGRFLGIELVQLHPEGARMIYARLDSKTNNLDELPDCVTLTTRYDNPKVPRWDISKAEKAYIMNLARKFIMDHDSSSSIYVPKPREGEYFSIEGHCNFLKALETPDTRTLVLRCGTGNNTYHRRYEGHFFVVQDGEFDHVFVLGTVGRGEGKPKPGLHHMYALNRHHARIYHKYR